MSQTKRIVRRPDFAGGGITDDEFARMAEHSRLWIARAMRTDPIDPEKIVPAILGLYSAANLKAPRVIVVPSPLVMAIAGGFAAAIWQARKRGSEATDLATSDATRAATDTATRDATDAATSDATYAATRDATRDATLAATDSATRDATYAATLAATDGKTEFAWVPSLAREISGGDVALEKLMIACIVRWHHMFHGGNMWAAWDCYLTAARDILGLKLPQHDAYSYWEQASIDGGYRVLHPEFALVCDFPEVLRVDDLNRPHCEDGHSHRWRDGWSLYYWHGVRVAPYIIEHPEQITPELIDQETNVEVRRVMIERYGAGRYLLDTGTKVIAHDDVGILYRKNVLDDEPVVMVRVLNSTPEPEGALSRDDAIAIFGRGRAAMAAVNAPDDARFKEYMLRVPPTMCTAREAVAWTFGLSANEYSPYIET